MLSNFCAQPFLQNPGQGHGGLFQAEWGGLRVFLKVSKRNTLQELQHSTILSDFDLGPRLHGWTSVDGVNVVFVYTFVEGFHMNPYSPIPPDFPSTPSIPARVLEIGQILTDLGYKHTKDLQFRISRGGQVHVVDTEMFSYDVPAQFLNLPEEYRPLEQPLQSARRLAHRIQQRNLQLDNYSGR